MNIYLTIITTALVITQIIRLVQNSIQLDGYEGKKRKEELVSEILMDLTNAIKNNTEQCQHMEQQLISLRLLVKDLSKDVCEKNEE